jgi:hypothetical protein
LFARFFALFMRISSSNKIDKKVPTLIQIKIKSKNLGTFRFIRIIRTILRIQNKLLRLISRLWNISFSHFHLLSFLFSLIASFLVGKFSKSFSLWLNDLFLHILSPLHAFVMNFFVMKTIFVIVPANRCCRWWINSNFAYRLIWGWNFCTIFHFFEEKKDQRNAKKWNPFELSLVNEVS